jgi:hypothetical protein
MFTVFYGGITKAERREWLEDIADRGETTVPIADEWSYAEIVNRTGIKPGKASTPEFCGLIEEIAEFGLTPAVHLSVDQNLADMAMVDDGRMEAQLVRLAPYADILGFVSLGWELAGSWRSKQICRAAALARRCLGPSAVIALHSDDKERGTGASYHGAHEKGTPISAGFVHKPTAEWIEVDERTGKVTVFDGFILEDDDPAQGDEPGWWYCAGADEIDLYLLETRHGREGPSFTLGDPKDAKTWLGRGIECWERFAPPNTFMPALGRMVRTPDVHGHIAPDWFGDPRRKRGRPRFSIYETVPYEYSRDECSDDQVLAVNRRLGQFGLVDFGCGVPR